MNEKAVKRIELLIFEKGFSSVRSFSEYVKERDPQNYVSEDTISNVIKGKGFYNDTLVVIAKGLGVPVDCLTAEKIPLVDEYLFEEVLPIKEEWDNGIKDNREKGINNLETVRRLYDTSRRICPDEIGGISSQKEYKITTLSEFCIYYPLCRESDVAEVIYRICGQIEGSEDYLLKQFAWLYSTIPDSPAKKIADCQAVIQRLSHKTYLDEEEERSLESMENYKNSESWKKGFMDYRNIISKKKKLYENHLFQVIFRAEMPELYTGIICGESG